MRDDLLEAALAAEYPYEFASYWVDVFIDVSHPDDIGAGEFLRYLATKAKA